VRFLGRKSHAFVRAAQRMAHLLVNIGNTDDVQVPGKLFEYFGAGRPILHLAQTATDPSAGLIRARRRGLAVRAERDALADALRRLSAASASADLEFDLDPAAVDDFSWPQIAARLERLLLGIVAPPASRIPVHTLPR
jgi:glycosyltransferase involved in cell wall biosynthesis